MTVRKAFALFGASQLVLTSVALAQVAPTPAPTQADTGQPAATVGPAAVPPNTGDIIVTARRRAENLQDVPISITAVSGKALAERGVRDALDLQYQTPSLTVTANGASRNNLAYSIRGQRTQEAQLLTDPPVGTYFAEVVLPRTYGFGTAFYDLQNVQVLKGVQGTLFGRNMTGGAVLIEPNHPDLGDYHAEAVGQYGNLNMKDVYGMLNVPVVKDVFGLRVAGKYRNRDGFTKDVSTGRDYDDQNYYAFRVSGELKVDRLTSYTVFDYLREREHGTALKSIGFALADPANGSPTVVAQQIGASPFFPIAAGVPPEDLQAKLQSDLGLGHYRVNYGDPANNSLNGIGGAPSTFIRNWGITNKTSFEAGPVTFKNIFGYRKIRYINQGDYDGSSAQLLYDRQEVASKNISEEFQMQGTPFGSRLQLTLGGYFFRESGSDNSFTSNFAQLNAIGYASAIPALAGYFLTQPASAYQGSNLSGGVARSYAFYAAGTYTITERLKFSGGLRFNDDLREARVNPTLPQLTIPGAGTGFCLFNGQGTFSLANCEQRAALKNSALTWDATLQYEPVTDLTTYAAVRRGYRAGGFNLRAQSDATYQPFQPETVREYEVGIKKTFEFDGGARLTTNVAAYYQDYKNVQKQNAFLVNGTVGTIITNTAAQHNYGGEFEANLRLPSGLGANLFYSYIKNKVVRGDNGTFAMQGVPHHQLGGGLSYAHELPGVGTLVGNVNATYRSKAPLDEFDTISFQKGYTIANGRIGLDQIAGTKFGAAIFANNIFDTYYKQGGIYLISNGPVLNGVNPGGGPGFASSTFGEPTTYGIEVSLKF